MRGAKPILMAGHRIIGSSFPEYFREFAGLYRMTREEVTDLTSRRLKDVIDHVRVSIPFYRDLGLSEGTGIADFPVMTKESIAKNFHRLMPEAFADEVRRTPKQTKGPWIVMQTGGSTGMPTTVIHDKKFRAFARAAKLFANEVAGIPVGSPYFMLWGSMKDINDMSGSRSARGLNALLGVRILNAFLMDPSRMRSYIDEINRSSVDRLVAYVDAAETMTDFAVREQIPLKKLKSIMACAGTLTKDTRGLLEQAYGCRVHNKYGSRECGDMAVECDHGGMHIFSNAVHLEIVDDAGRPVPEGEGGRVLVTILNNPSFPLIRYEIGDIGRLRAGECGCGLPLPMLETIEGRAYEVVTDTRGNKVSPVYFRHLIGVVHNDGSVRRFQLVQDGARSYRLALEIHGALNHASRQPLVETLKADLLAVLGRDALLGIEFTSSISLTESGKFLYCRNEFSRAGVRVASGNRNA